jgi:hypothetical protein
MAFFALDLAGFGAAKKSRNGSPDERTGALKTLGSVLASALAQREQAGSTG